MGTGSAERASMVVGPGPEAGTVRTARGEVLRVPVGWVLVKPGDPGLTRRIKGAGVTAGGVWTVQEKVGRKLFSRGVWVSREVVERETARLEEERRRPEYAKKLAGAAARRERVQGAYVETFREAVERFLGFAPVYAALGKRVAMAVAAHATPVGSGTVARTSRIPVEQRAEAAVIAWLRHRTTGYDTMVIPREKGKRREVRRMLAERSRRMLESYRRGVGVERCLLTRALAE